MNTTFRALIAATMIGGVALPAFAQTSPDAAPGAAVSTHTSSTTTATPTGKTTVSQTHKHAVAPTGQAADKTTTTTTTTDHH